MATTDCYTESPLQISNGKQKWASNREECQVGLDAFMTHLADAISTRAPLPEFPEGISVTEACNVLAAWNRHFNSESRGAVFFRE